MQEQLKECVVNISLHWTQHFTVQVHSLPSKLMYDMRGSNFNRSQSTTRQSLFFTHTQVRSHNVSHSAGSHLIQWAILAQINVSLLFLCRRKGPWEGEAVHLYFRSVWLRRNMEESMPKQITYTATFQSFLT